MRAARFRVGVVWVGVLASLLLQSTPVDGQLPPSRGAGSGAELPQDASSGPRVQFSTNPFLLLVEWLNLEGEFAVGSTVSVGFTTSYIHDIDWYWDDDDDEQSVLGGTVLFRYYPQGRVLQDFYVGARAGIIWAQDEGGSDDAFPGFGLEFGYNWVFGEDDGFLLGIGAGLSRYTEGFLPIIRLVNVGWAF